MLKRLRTLLGQGLPELVLERAPVAVAVLQGEALRVIYVNSKAKSMARLEHDVEGKRIEQALPQVNPQTLAMLRGVLHTGRPDSIKEIKSLSIPSSRGAYSYLNIDCFPLAPRHGGEENAVVLLVLDVTEQVDLRREAEGRAREIALAHHALAVREQLLRMAASSAPQILYARDRDLRLQWVYNPRSIGNLDAYVGQGLADMVAPEDARVLEPLYREVMETGEPRERLVRLHELHLSEARWQNIYVRPLRDEHGHITGVICASYDVTELVETRAALAEREALLELALEAGEMAAWEYDPSTRKLRYSASYTKILGLAGDAREADIGFMLDYVHPHDRARVQQYFEQAVSQRSYLNIEHRIVRPDQTERWLMMRALVLDDGPDGAPRMHGVTIDITDERELRTRLEDNNRALERFARTVAHDLKSPLQAMVGFGTLVTRSARERLTPQEREQLDYVLESGHQMSTLIDGILAYARAVHNTPVREAVDLEQLLAQALTRLHAELQSAEAEVVHDPLPTVTGNPVLLAQVLQNLISNALKYRHPDRPLRIAVSAERRENQWLVHVRDNGIGIAPEHCARLFEAFTRAHAEFGHEGLGLGLSLVRDAVEHHDGHVWVESVPNQGSTFSFSIPG